MKDRCGFHRNETNLCDAAIVSSCEIAENGGVSFGGGIPLMW